MSKEATSRKLHLEGHNLCIVWECVKCGRFKPDRRFHDMVEHIENVCKKSPYTWEDVKILTVSYTEAERLCPPRGTPKAESLEAAEGPTRSSLRTSSRSRHQSFESRSERRSLDHCRVETTSHGVEFRRAGEKRLLVLLSRMNLSSPLLLLLPRNHPAAVNVSTARRNALRSPNHLLARSLVIGIGWRL